MTGSKESLQFNKFEIYSNEGVGSVDLRSGTPRIEYRESVFVPYVTITAAIVDTGNAFEANDGSGKTISLLDSIKCQGTEKILFDIEDGNGNKIKFTNKSWEVIYGRISYHQKIYNFSVINSNHFSLFNITNFFLV